MRPSIQLPIDNRLIEALPRVARHRIAADGKEVELVPHDVLCSSGEQIRFVYFPTTGFISLLTPIDQRSMLEVGLVGNEGMFGVSLALGVKTSFQQGLVQGSGTAVRMTTAAFRRVLADSPALQQRLNRYAHVQMSQFALAAACARYHLVEARLARWLLSTQDRAHSAEFAVTQEFLAYMLGVRRAGVTQSAGALQRRRLIRYRRGVMTVLDRKGLEAAACSCYRVGAQLYDRVMH